MAESVEELLDKFAKASKDADADAYFSCFLDDTCRFLGTDAKENWTVKEFKDFAIPYFQSAREKGKAAWTYTLIRGTRKIDYYCGDDNETAYFDELLASESFLCTSRGNGVAVKRDRMWYLLQYHLSFPIPNPLAKSFCEIIHKFEREEATNDEETEKLLLEMLMRRAHDRKKAAATGK
jgi:hypothetical protein